MIDHAEFLATILDRPDDDGPRLVFADWLEEQGEAERAELIRVQCEMAGTTLKLKEYREGSGPTVKIPRTSDQCSEWLRLIKIEMSLRVRSLTLFRLHAKEWWPTLGEVGVKCIPCEGTGIRHEKSTWYQGLDCRLCHGSGRIVTDCTMRVPFTVQMSGPRGIGTGIEFTTLTIARGFPDSVEVSMLGLVGEPCWGCEGGGRVPREEYDSASDEMEWAGTDPCPRCNGKGRTGSIAPLLSTLPLTGIKVLGREPYASPTYPLGNPPFRFGWCDNDNIANATSHIGEQLWSYVAMSKERIIMPNSHNFAFFDTQPAAIAALDAAGLSYIRSLRKC